MVLTDKLKNIFKIDIPIIGMIHLAGHSSDDKYSRALEEVEIYREEGVDGIIVENYHGLPRDVIETLKLLRHIESSVVGVNILPNDYGRAFAYCMFFGAKFIQLDYIAGTYYRETINKDGRYFYTIGDGEAYTDDRKDNSKVIVLGGVHTKYYTPLEGSNLEADLKSGMERCDAIVVTGEGTGKETPMDKIIEFRKLVGDFPLIVGAGLTPKNVYEQLMIADGGIVGSYFKAYNNTENPVNRNKVREFMNIVKEIRKEKN